MVLLSENLEIGSYGDGRNYLLPTGWPVIQNSVLSNALAAANDAVFSESALPRLRSYFNPTGDFAGTSFLDAEPNPPRDLVAADLYALSRLSMTIHNYQGRLVLGEGPSRNRALELLRAIPADARITDLDPGILQKMWTFYDHLRTLLSTPERKSNHWVFAAKLCARKRPNLFPVRDSKVCELLAGDLRPKLRVHRIGQFQIDLQFFAHVMTDDKITGHLAYLQRTCSDAGVRTDASLLRLMDVLLWTAATQTSP